MFRLILSLCLLAATVYFWPRNDDNGVSENNVSYDKLPDLDIQYKADLSINRPPVQEKRPPAIAPFAFGAYTITLVAEFQVAARVLGAKHYRSGREADLSPVDLALGWGPMARDEILDEISVRQSNRFYHWQTDEFPIPRREIETNSANMHFIPLSEEVEKKLKQVAEGENIRFKGYLVRVSASDGWRWISSTTRNDTGAGACEVILIDDISPL